MNKAFEKILKRLTSLKEKYGILQLGFSDSAEVRKYVGMEQSVDLSMEIVQEVEKEYKGGWIPVSECLPNQDGEFTDVLITCESMVDGVFVQSAEFYLASDGSLVFDALYHYNKVLAWKPLPEPYREIEVNNHDDQKQENCI